MVHLNFFLKVITNNPPEGGLKIRKTLPTLLIALE